MPGTKCNAFPIREIIVGYNVAAVTASLYLNEVILPFKGRILAVKVYAVTAGTGAGNTVVDVLLNGTTIWATAANKPTLLATATGEFANTMPTTQSFNESDRLTLIVASISTTGHARLSVSVAVGMP